MASSPDALGIISWNEFSENRRIEPSKAFGSSYLNVLSEINRLPPPMIGEFHSSEPAAEFPDPLTGSRGIALGGIVFIVIAGFIIIARRRI